jgi:hypothetical protein
MQFSVTDWTNGGDVTGVKGSLNNGQPAAKVERDAGSGRQRVSLPSTNMQHR